MKKTLFFVGPHACGKSYFAYKYVNNANEYIEIIDTGPIMRRLHAEQSPDIPIGQWVDNLEQEYGPNITNELICKEIQRLYNNNQYNVIFLIGFRSLEGIEFAINSLNIIDYKILYIDADIELLYDNYISREGFIEFDAFKEKLNMELQSGLDVLKEEALTNKNDNYIYFYKKSNLDDLSDVVSQFVNNIDAPVLRRGKND